MLSESNAPFEVALFVSPDNETYKIPSGDSRIALCQRAPRTPFYGGIERADATPLNKFRTEVKPCCETQFYVRLRGQSKSLEIKVGTPPKIRRIEFSLQVFVTTAGQALVSFHDRHREKTILSPEPDKNQTWVGAKFDGLGYLIIAARYLLPGSNPDEFSRLRVQPTPVFGSTRR